MAEWQFCGRNSLQGNFFQPILVGWNKVAEDAREVFSALKSSIEIRKEKDTSFYECETQMIFVEHKNVKERVNAINFWKGVGECVFERSCKDGTFRYLKYSQC